MKLFALRYSYPKLWHFGWILLSLVLIFATGCIQSEDGPETATETVRPSLTPEIGVTLATVARPTQVIVQVTPTPSSTPSPTPTPTPMVYLIEEGDTLLGIAIDNNTTVDAIETLNPGIQPNLLQIGQQVILPPPATPSFQSAAVTQVPLQVEVLNLNIYRTPSGGIWLVGEVMNNGQLTAENIQLQLGLSDLSGQGIAAVKVWVTPGILPSGAKAPFGVLVPDITVDSTDSLAPPSAAIIGGQTMVDIGNRYLDLSVVEGNANIEESQVELGGQIVNTGAETAKNVLLVTTFYDAQGNVTGFHEYTIDSPLAPGEETPFNYTAATPGGQIVEYKFLVQGLVINNP